MAGDRPDDRPVVMAVVAGAHGVTGEVRLKLFCTSADSLKGHRLLTVGGRSLTLAGVRPSPQGAVARFAGIGDRTAAEALRGQELAVPRSSLPPLGEGEYYWHDLVGLMVVDQDGSELGAVVTVENFGASDLLDIALLDGRRVLVPMVPAAVQEIGAQIRIDRLWVDAA